MIKPLTLEKACSHYLFVYEFYNFFPQSQREVVELRRYSIILTQQARTFTILE